MHTIGIANQKGGVGKTTTAVNLAAGLALSGRSTLLVDMDPQGNATSGLGISRDALDHTIHEALLGHSPVEACALPTGIENLAVIPSDVRLIGAERELLDAQHRDSRLAGVLAPLAQRYQYAIVDCPPSLGLLTLNVLRGVRHLIIPIQSEYYALEGLSMLLETIEHVRQSTNPDLEILGLLMTMVDGRTNLARQVVREVLEHFGDRVFHTVIARSVRLGEAPSYGQPILTYDPHSPAAEAHRALTQEVITRCEVGISSIITGQQARAEPSPSLGAIVSSNDT